MPVPTYSIQNGSVAANIDLAEPDDGDFRALGYGRTGVISTATSPIVHATGTPSMSVLVDAAEILIDGVPISKPQSTVTLDPATASPRFDLIGWNVLGNAVSLKGTPDATNPTYPTNYDPSTFCLAAIVYVGANATSITNSFIVQKQATPITSLRRNYPTEVDVMLESITPAKPTSFKMLANGTMSWVSSMLQRTSDVALEWLTSLTIRQQVPAATNRALILKPSIDAAKGDKVFDLQQAVAVTSMASLDAVGLFSAANFRFGSGTPEGTVLADRPALYLNTTAADGNTAIYVKTTDGSATGWLPLGAYVANAQAIPVGCCLPWPGTGAPPAGYLLCDGSEQSATTYVALNAFCTTRFGAASAGMFRMPDYRGMTFTGCDATNPLPGVALGAATMTLTTAHLPSHPHPLTSETHEHPRGGQYLYVREQPYLPPYAIPNNPGTGLGVATEPPDFDHSALAAPSGTTTAVGGDQPFSLMQPSSTTNWIMKT